MRAKDNNFQADYELITDPSLPLINVVPQDMGRVLLNLMNNAFWAVGQRAKGLEHGGHYVPKVMVSTKMVNNQIIIKVSDNGAGIPADILPKIFQPFFTTKPTGQGAGLGLSLAYDIVTKGHGGSIEVESTEGEGTMFIVNLPI
jgi:signal transduction histidine kinase